ncbi:MAG: hypothetical protein IAE79_29025 [Anaerolinea sp.]|nr:hypothetical protein [Anaerolinea sp.]
MACNRWTIAGKEGNPRFHPGARALNEAIEHLLHLLPPLKQEVVAVLNLIQGILIAEATLNSLLFGQDKMEVTAIQPTVADLTQLPYSVL